ncbi:MAG TPA: isoprenylcysteine carboxylmethyltransferase family protein [Candidatus Paceibacterota bacterium]|jgi:protein-S-isoprenylcysteine O-methyltransferase Ste14|nr:isoprenylcysteine carboxylmethyltransferase family protein [Candidatus Paceibacterota bacterium]
MNIISISWLTFLIFWIATWGWTKETAKKRSGKDRIWYVITLFIGWMFLWEGNIFTKIFPFNIFLIYPTHHVIIIANILAVLGVALAIWSRVTLGSNWSGSVQIKKGHELVTSGPYHYVRHPIYAAIFLLLLATGLAIGTVGALLGFIIMMASFYIKAAQEEAYMLEQFPDQYPAYMKRTKRILPLLF